MDEQQKSQQSVETSETPISAAVNATPQTTKPSHRKRWLIIASVIVLAMTATVAYLLLKPHKVTESSASTTSQTAATAPTPANQAQGLQLDPKKNYGDKYADGILPVGDNKYTTDKAEKGKIYVCHANFVAASQAGAQTRGPWFVDEAHWDINKKSAIQGSVQWQQSITVTIDGQLRVVRTNDLPDHPTGVFPVAASDPARRYDANPNTISSQSLVYNLAAVPSYGDPQCLGGEVGVMLTGVALFDGFDAGGRDAGAWEVQDNCEGHPQNTGIYHYHTLSSCIKNIGVGDVIGFALDGFPITGPKVGDKNYLTTSDLDDCHGITSDYSLDGKKTNGFHYVMTQDFPYSASCFRAKAVQSPAQHNAQAADSDHHQ
jgi:hypothetical protein